MTKTTAEFSPYRSGPPFLANDYVFRVANTPDDIKGFWGLRRQTFCEEQGMFEASDSDKHDRNMIPLVCNSLLAGMEDRVVGAVRIEERQPGLWWGGRLCVAPAYRRIAKLSPAVAHRHRLPQRWRSVGAGLVYAAVTTAHTRGCHTFLATVQRQNAHFFRLLHWDPIEELDLYGRPHVKMRADLRFYPPLGVFSRQ